MASNRKALLVSTVSGFVPQFEMHNVHILQSMGFEVHYAANYQNPSYGNDNHRLDHTGIIQHQVDFVRSPFKIANFIAYKQLKQLMIDYHFDLVHCHTPMGGVLTRLASHRTKTRPVIYTAHGFHFYSGAPWINWLCYYPIEKYLSYYTDQQICINNEDYQRAKAKFHAKYTDYIPGVGIDLSSDKYHSLIDIQSKKKELGLPLDKTIILSTGELIKRKNQTTILYALAELKKSHPYFHFILCGQGVLKEHLHQMVDSLHLTDCVSFLGYRTDIFDIYRLADIFIFPSYQEGLPMALLEAMACGLPVICSDIRGNRDLMSVIESREDFTLCQGGIMIKTPDDAAAYCQVLQMLLDSPEKLSSMGSANQLQAQHFSADLVNQKMKAIYSRFFH